MFWFVPQRCSFLYKNYIHLDHLEIQVSMWVMSTILKFFDKFPHCFHKSHEFFIDFMKPRFWSPDKIKLKFYFSLIQNHIPVAWHPWIFFPLCPGLQFCTEWTFSILMDCKYLVSKNTFPHRTSSFLWNWKVAVLITCIWPLVLLHWNTFGWVDFASNILQCGKCIV